MLKSEKVFDIVHLLLFESMRLVIFKGFLFKRLWLLFSKSDKAQGQ